jgi:type I restriction enzyme S subunit
VALLDSVHGRAYFETTAKKTTNLASTNSTTLGAFPVFLPPLDEQRAILEHVEGELRPIDHAIARADREIELMREFRTCLVSSVVSGALDVRAVAVLLPEGGPEDLGSGDPDLDEAVDLLEEEPVEEEAAA